MPEIPIEIADYRKEWSTHQSAWPANIFHYTDARGLEGILRSRQLWATHVYYLNDSLEFRFASKIINQVFENAIAQRSGKTESELLKRLYDSFRTQSHLWESLADIYVACFCTKGNLLSQWRAYGANGSGYCIEFSPHDLMDVQAAAGMGSNTRLVKVVYDPYEQQSWVCRAIEYLLLASKKLDMDLVCGSVPLVFSEMLFAFKHSAFSEEQEWRLVFVPEPAKSAEFINVRESGGQFIPYACMPISNEDQHKPCVSITHGPTLDALNTERALKVLLGKTTKHFTDINVSGSDAPLKERRS